MLLSGVSRGTIIVGLFSFKLTSATLVIVFAPYPLAIDDKVVYLIGLNNEKVTDKIKGLTIGGAYIDEVTTVPRSAFDNGFNKMQSTKFKSFLYY